MNLPRPSNRRFLIGIDEAGRGPVLGPMVVAMVIIEESGTRELVRIGAKDSKCFGSGPAAHKNRCVVARNIRKISRKVSTTAVSPQDIDEFGITHAELAAIASLVRRIPKGITGIMYVDANGGMSRKTFLGHLTNHLGHRPSLRLVYKPRAEKRYPVVAAASVVAKVCRDRSVWKLLGRRDVSGYPNRATAQFIRKYFTEHTCLPPGTRKSWQWPPLQRFLT